MTSSSTMIIEYAKSTQNVCICLAISLFLIIVFMMTPLNTFILSQLIWLQPFDDSVLIFHNFSKY